LPKKILILPDAGPGNPFQYLMIDWLRRQGHEVATGERRRFFATFTAVRRHRPAVVYYDWIQSFILGKTLLVTLLKMATFWLELQYLARVQKVPVVHTLHNLRNHAGRWWTLERAIYRIFLRQCARIRVYSEATRDTAAERFGLDKKKIFVIPDIPYHHHYPRGADRPAGRAHLHLPEGAFVYLFLGLVKPYKGVEELVDAFIRTGGPGDYLVIAGASDQPAYAAALAGRIGGHPRILFHNQFVPADLVQYYYAAADVVVLPFRNIEHSGSVDLAMSFGRAVITLRTAAHGRLLAHQDALLFGSTDELAAKMALAKTLDLEAPGRSNFRKADHQEYQELLRLFE
jgi:glycosyltransferase involved in cell wall biosynthesis